MALQGGGPLGVSQQDIWQTLQDMGLDYPALPQPGFSARAVDTLRFYKGKSARLYFPTYEEVRETMSPWFRVVECHVPTYEFGECCPIVSLTVL